MQLRTEGVEGGEEITAKPIDVVAQEPHLQGRRQATALRRQLQIVNFSCQAIEARLQPRHHEPSDTFIIDHIGQDADLAGVGLPLHNWREAAPQDRRFTP